MVVQAAGRQGHEKVDDRRGQPQLLARRDDLAQAAEERRRVGAMLGELLQHHRREDHLFDRLVADGSSERLAVGANRLGHQIERAARAPCGRHLVEAGVEAQ